MSETKVAIDTKFSNRTSQSTLDQLLERHLDYLAQKHYSPATLKVRRIRLRIFMNWCTANAVAAPASITRKVVESYQTYLFRYQKRNGEPLGRSTQHSRLISLGVWLKWMARQNVLEHNPVADIELPRSTSRLPEVLTARESEAILHLAVGAEPVKIRDRAILETFYSTGMRRNELLSLKLRDFNMESGVVAIRSGKGNRDRIIPVGDRCLHWISRYLSDIRPRFVEQSDTETVFLTRTGRRFSPNHLSALVAKYVRSAGVGKRGACHLFRHTMATLMLEGGADIRYIQQMLGHAKLDTTQIYTHVSVPVLKIVHSRTHPASQTHGRRRKLARAGMMRLLF